MTSKLMLTFLYISPPSPHLIRLTHPLEKYSGYTTCCLMGDAINALKHGSISLCHSKHYKKVQCSAVQRNAMQCNAMQCNAMQCLESQSSSEPESWEPGSRASGRWGVVTGWGRRLKELGAWSHDLGALGACSHGWGGASGRWGRGHRAGGGCGTRRATG